MKTLRYTILLLTIAGAIIACKPKYGIVKQQGTHISPFFPETNTRVELSYIGIPPMPVSESERITQPCLGNVFTIYVMDCVDHSGYAEELVGPIATQLKTSLRATNRFEIKDGGVWKDLVDEVFVVKREGSEGRPVSSGGLKIDSLGKSQTKYGRFIQDDDITLRQFEREVDGVLNIIITSKKHVEGDSSMLLVNVQVQLISALSNNTDMPKNLLIYANQYDIKAYHRFDTREISIEKEFIDKIAEDIKQKFPPASVNDGLKILEKNETEIFINAGRNKGVSVGMSGFIVYQNKVGLPDCRNRFVITQPGDTVSRAQIVFDEGGLDKLIFDQVRVAEPVVLK